MTFWYSVSECEEFKRQTLYNSLNYKCPYFTCHTESRLNRLPLEFQDVAFIIKWLFATSFISSFGKFRFCNIDLNMVNLNSVFHTNFFIFCQSLVKNVLFVYEKSEYDYRKKTIVLNKLPIHYLTPTLLQRLTMLLKAASSPDLLMIW